MEGEEQKFKSSLGKILSQNIDNKVLLLFQDNYASKRKPVDDTGPVIKSLFSQGRCHLWWQVGGGEA